MEEDTLKMHTYLKAWRKHKSLSQEHLGNILNVAHTTIGRWEKGTVPLTTADLERLAETYGISVRQLLMPPEAAELVANLERAQRVMDSMDSADIENWLSLGEKASGIR
ncbi:hypothetical protein HK16_09705 [Acetobacter senegalensis]|uniref:HTH cro/C1-type domain-containing protein n=2 Tax=Acetobacter TaxID=434 RepID=A0A252EME2_9PROT|nr:MULTISPECIES: helix-turn-helix transcriptional regulator [Acetobacter]ATJ90417.1 XRE family transcriptional regulator [Acetobacter tropicalis]OUL67578.1 hypothetical protein HK16_09705 [Acetobacter senegalensis]